MTNQVEDGGPAFAHGNPEQGGHPGMTLRQYAAIQLRVPDSGVEWLDAMIRASLRDQFAEQALPFVLAELRRAHLGIGDSTFPQNVACHCYRVADAMLAARKGDAS